VNSEQREKHRIVDLFSGAGGLSLGAARAGFRVCGAVEIDPHAVNIHKLNFPKAVHLETDVSKLNADILRRSMGLNNGDLTGIIGGPPCQGFSHIGRKKKNDDRNTLFVEFFRIVSEAVPKFFLAENVPGIMDERNSDIRKKAMSYVENDYVLLQPMKLAAHEYGAPTTRTRVFFVGYRKNEMAPLSPDDFLPPDGTMFVRVKDALRGLPKRINPNWQTEKDSWRIVRYYGNGTFTSRLHSHIPEGVGNAYAIERLKVERRISGFLGTVHKKEIEERYRNIEKGKRDPISKSPRLDPEGFCPTIRAGTGSDRGSFQAVRPLHPTENRVITPREAARLQGFPDWFQFSPTKWHSFRQIGSSVSPIIAEHIHSVIITALGTDA